MQLKPKQGWLLAFTAVFAVLAGFVFWGTWSTDMAPVMPDCPTSYPVHWFRSFLVGWLENGKFAPAEAINWIGHPVIWTEFQYAFASYMSALGMVYFLRGRGLTHVAAYGAGLLLGFCGYWFSLFSAGHLGWFQWMTYGVFVFGLIDRALTKGKVRHWLLLGACLAWGSMRQPDLWLLFSVFSFAYFVFRFCTVLFADPKESRKVRLLSWLKGSLIALAALLCIGLASFRSAFVNDLAGRQKQIEAGETVGGDVKDEAEKRWIFTTNWSMPPEATKEFWDSRVEGDTSCPMTLAIGNRRRNGIKPYTGRLGRPKDAPSGNYRQHSLNVGLLTMLLAIVGTSFGWGKKDKTVIFLSVSALVFWLFSMGRFCAPVYHIVYALPFGDYLRAPVKWHHLTEFCLVALAGYGINYWMLTPAKWLGCRGKTIAAVLLVLFAAYDLASVNRLYCAPHRVEADMQLIDARIAQDKRGRAQLEAHHAKVIGAIGSVAVIEIPKPANPNEPVPELPKPAPVTLTLAVLSVVSTLFALIFSLVSVLRRKRA